MGLLLLSFSSCSKEDSLEPTEAEKNYFAPDENATDEESLLRRDFYKKNNSYLLFNDTLRHEPLGVNSDGVMQYFTETLDVSYVMAGTTSYFCRYDYIASIDDKRNAISFVENYLLAHLSDKLRPFSWLLVDHITGYSLSDGVYTYQNEPSSVVGNRATAVALEGVSDMEEEEKTELANTILTGLVSDKVAAQSASVLKSFTKYSSSLYETYSGLIPSSEEENMTLMNQSGFITGHYYYEIYLSYGTYPSQSEDVSSFAKLVLTQSEDEVNDTYADYPLVLEKYRVMKAIITELGFVF
jgi:hypothetical protein